MAGKKILTYNDKKYDMETLIINHYDKNEKFYEGDVINLTNGEIYEISELPNIYVEMNRGLLDNAEHLTYNQRNRIANLINNKMKSYRIKHLNKKLEADVITKEELEELILKEEGRDLSHELNSNNGIKANIITKFIKVSQENPLPREISMPQIGRFHRLLETTVSKGKVLKRAHGNSIEPTRKELMDYLECKSLNTFKNFIKEMEKYDLVRYLQLPNNRNIIFINPLYAHSDLIISKELFGVFKDVLEKKLDHKIIKYMELAYTKGENSGSLTFKN